MKTYKELFIIDRDEFLSYISTRHESDYWNRSIETEEKFKSNFMDEQYCFKYIGVDFTTSLLWIGKKEEQLYVTNIVPDEVGQLSIDEYNDLLNSWKNDYLDDFTGKLNMTKDEVSLIDFVDESIVKKLEIFSHAANKSTGHSHPSDEKRWFDFICTCVIHKSKIKEDLLMSELKSLGWDETSAYKLTIDFEYGYNAMNFLDENHEKY